MQQVNYANISQILVFTWFAVSVFIAVVGTVAFRLWLRRLGVRLVLGLAGTPGYMEYGYLKWCRTQGRRPNRGIIVFRAVSAINAIIASVFFVAITGR